MRTLVSILLLGLVLIVALLDLTVGSADIGVSEALAILAGRSADPLHTKILTEIRLPRMLMAAIAGGGLAIAGLMMQTLFRNPLAGPSVLGITSGSSLAIALYSMLGGVGMQWGGPVVSAFIGAIVVLFIILLAEMRTRNAITLLIVGLMVGYLCSSVVSIIEANSAAEGIRRFVIWGMGSFDGAMIGDIPIILFIVIPCLVVVAVMSNSLNALLLGEENARAVGLNIVLVKRAIIFLAGALTAVITAFAGPIAFLGLAVPHIARGVFRTADHRILLPATLLIGCSVALICDMIVHADLFENGLPLNAVTSMFGAPVVLWILFKGRNWYAA